MANKSEKKRVSIALQGGGAHGGFTWGVLDRLLEDERIEIEGLTGTSAGAMNAICVAQGLARGNNETARQELKDFWKRISDSGKHSSLNNRGPIDKMLGEYTMNHSPGFMMFDYLSRILSPYELNPSGTDPLKEVIEKSFDFDLLRTQKKCKVFLCATQVFTGNLRIFSTEELSVDTMLATACLPTLHGAVTVEGEYYWDGGFTGNPVFFPLIYNCKTPDIILIQLNPTVRAQLPKTAREIADRLNEITNNSSVMREMRSIHYITQLIDSGQLDSSKHPRVYMHLIKNEEVFQKLGWSSKLNTEWEFLMHLFEAGRQTASDWLKANFDGLGEKTTVDIA